MSTSLIIFLQDSRVDINIAGIVVLFEPALADRVMAPQENRTASCFLIHADYFLPRE
jgi:hypothetical protein